MQLGGEKSCVEVCRNGIGAEGLRQHPKCFQADFEQLEVVNNLAIFNHLSSAIEAEHNQPLFFPRSNDSHSLTVGRVSAERRINPRQKSVSRSGANWNSHTTPLAQMVYQGTWDQGGLLVLLRVLGTERLMDECGNEQGRRIISSLRARLSGSEFVRPASAVGIGERFAPVGFHLAPDTGNNSVSKLNMAGLGFGLEEI